MKKIILIAVSIFILGTAGVMADGVGSAFGNFSTAQTSGMGSGSMFAGVGFADATSVIGAFTYGLSAHTDGRLKLALVDNDGSDTKFAFSADFKYNFISTGELQNGPFDMALGGFAEYYDYDGASVFTIGAQYLGSYPFQLNDSRKSFLVPYGRFNARMEMISWDNPLPNGDDSDSNLEFGLNAGVKWQMTPTIDLFGEFQFDGNDGFFVGLDFNVM